MSCDPATDKNCTMTKGACDTECSKHMKSMCDHSTGKCVPCQDGKGCIPADACKNSCKIVPPSDLYKCNWSNSTCEKDPKGTLDQKSCQDECVAVKFGKCDY